MTTDEFAIFEKFTREKGLKHSKQREKILQVFLSIEKHLTAEELWQAAKKKDPAIGHATVYRTMKLLCECGLCSELNLEDGTTRYEHLYGHEHHDHLICIECGSTVEVVDQVIEKLQEELMKKHGFLPIRHRMNLFGTCQKCSLHGRKNS